MGILSRKPTEVVNGPSGCAIHYGEAIGNHVSIAPCGRSIRSNNCCSHCAYDDVVVHTDNCRKCEDLIS